MSTPSVFFSVKDWPERKGFYVFDVIGLLYQFDEKFGVKNPNFFKYDFNKPEDIPEKYNNYFDYVLIDPPFITEDVWAKYAKAVVKIAKKDQEGKIIAKILLSSIDENEQLLKKLLNVSKKKYRPSIPHLVYQYSFYANYED
jgi:predicted methyltransferase